MKKICHIPNAANFAQQLKAWRKEKGLTQKQLADLLGVSKTAVGNYEHRRNRVSPRIAKKLISLGFDKTLIDVGKEKFSDWTLNDEERQFAADQHAIVMKFLSVFRLSYDEWYDVIIFGYLKAVKDWFSKLETHTYSFTTIAFRKMRTAYLNDLQYQKRRPEYRAVSLDDIIPGTDDMTYADMLCDPRDCVGI